MVVVYMEQNQKTGASGVEFGYEIAKIIAKYLNTELLSPKSNEILIDGERFVIKSGHRKTSSIGITVNMFKRLQGIIAVFEIGDGIYTLYKINLKKIPSSEMIDSESTGHKKNKVIKISRKSIIKHGEVIGTI